MDNISVITYIYIGLSLSVAFSAFALSLSMCRKSSMLCQLTKYVSAIISAVFFCNFFTAIIHPSAEPYLEPKEIVFLISMAFLLGLTAFKYMYREWQLMNQGD